MKESIDQRVRIRVFLGYLLTLDLQNHLHNSKTWKQAMILWQSEENGLTQVNREGKSYIGKYFDLITMDDLNELEKRMKEMVFSHCPEVHTDLLKICIFPQLFVS